MKFRRGFKTDANWYAREMRTELGIAAYAPLCPWKLAAHLEYAVVQLSEYENDEPQSVAYLMSALGQSEFSAITLYHRQHRIIIHNDAHNRGRQAANIAHELAHGLLMHTPASLVGEDGARTFNREQEDEAHWLGPALLISEEAAVHITRIGLSTSAACREYGVSEDLLQMRLQVTGALKRAAYRRAALASANIGADRVSLPRT